MSRVYRKAICDSGIALSEMDRGEVCRSDTPLLLLSFSSDSLDDIVESHPFNKIFIIGSVGICGTNIRYFRDLDELLSVLKVMGYRESKSALPLMTSSSVQRKKRKSAGKVKCPFCSGEIGTVELGLKNHLMSCREYVSRPAAFGNMVTERQPSGRSKGSYLIVYLPQAIYINSFYLRTGLHLITNGPLIKLLNAVLRDNFRYTLEKEEC
jgi:hypothetical protein